MAEAKTHTTLQQTVRKVVRVVLFLFTRDGGFDYQKTLYLKPKFNRNKEVVILGAGAAGLMTARELGIAGKETLILEARDRIGGRIWPLPSDEFGYSAQGGAEFVHGEAKVTTTLIRKAGLTLLPLLNGEVWTLRGSQLSKSFGGPTANPVFLAYADRFYTQLRALTDDISLDQFLERYFREDTYIAFRNWIKKMVEGYEAADLRRISTFALREGWLGGQEWRQSRIKEGYGALLTFLESECRVHNVEICLNEEVKTIRADFRGIEIACMSGYTCAAKTVVVTCPLPILKSIRFIPAFPEKITAASQIGFGQAIKFLLGFKADWWRYTLGKDLNKMMFLHCDEAVPTWWTQYPESYPVLTGWLSGISTEKFKHSSAKELLETAVTSLANTFRVRKDFVQTQLLIAKIFNWPADPYAQGGYSYLTPEAKHARKVLVEPDRHQIFFAGEALCSGTETATVEGALASGKETAERILELNR